MKEYWNYQFCEGDVNGLVKCYDQTDRYVGYRLLWERLGEYKSKSFTDLERPGIYFLFEKHARTENSRMYVGQGDLRQNKKGMLNRVKEHSRKGDKDWCDEVVFLPALNCFGSTELNWLEHRFYVDAKKCNRYYLDNGPKPHGAILRDEIKGVAEAFVENAKFLTAALGFTPFLASRQNGSEHQLDSDISVTPAHAAFIVKFANGKRIGLATASATFAEAIKIIGPTRVLKLGITRDKKPLLMNDRNSLPYPSSAHEVGDGVFVNTHASTSSNIDMLKEIFQKLGVNATVEQGND